MTSYTIEQHVQMIKQLYYQYQCSLAQTLRALRPFYGRRDRPSRSTLQRLVAKFETTGSISNKAVITYGQLVAHDLASPARVTAAGLAKSCATSCYM